MQVRPATPDDAAELVRLGALMYASMGLDVSGAEWRERGEATVRARIGGDELVAFVVDDPARPGGLAACGAATIAERLPGPNNPSGRVGYVQWMATEPAYRRRGLARAVFGAILAWLAERGVTAVELHATPVGEPLYRSFGFVDPPSANLRRNAGPAG